jgi:hypothetical protein
MVHGLKSAWAKKLVSWTRWCTPVIPALQEAVGRRIRPYPKIKCNKEGLRAWFKW